MFAKHLTACGVLMLAGLAVAGCGDSAVKSPAAAAKPGAGAEHTHDGWWCDEHGVPEEVCARCSTKLVADFKAKGDWCKEHERPDSQCFICHPEKEAEFAAQYEAKYGKKPPKPHDDADHDHHEHDAKS